jgi:2,4'-dihydroxyacetophenone dioxygenase
MRPAAQLDVTGSGHILENGALMSDQQTQRPATESLLEEILVQTADMPWRPKSLAGVHEKMLFRNEASGASVALIKFDKGASIPTPHMHSSNQMMLCLQGKYEYTSTGVMLVPGSFYCNPKGSVHGPTLAHEETVVVEIYDGPHYPQRPGWYDNDEDAR